MPSENRSLHNEIKDLAQQFALKRSPKIEICLHTGLNESILKCQPLTKQTLSTSKLLLVRTFLCRTWQS